MQQCWSQAQPSTLEMQREQPHLNPTMINQSSITLSKYASRRAAARKKYDDLDAECGAILTVLLRDDAFTLLGDTGWHALSRQHDKLIDLRRKAFARWLAL